MSIFNRLFKVGQAEAHNAINKLEDPIKLTQQGIRDMRGRIGESPTGDGRSEGHENTDATRCKKC